MRTRILAVLIAVCLPLAASAELVTGNWGWSIIPIGNDFNLNVSQAGPAVFGRLPEPGVEVREIAVLAETYDSYEPSFILPLPIYQDGTVAAIEDVFWTLSLMPVPVAGFYGCGGLAFFSAGYSGGGVIDIFYDWLFNCTPALPFQIVGVAARPMEPVGVRQDSFGGVKSMYEE